MEMFGDWTLYNLLGLTILPEKNVLMNAMSG